LFDDVEISVRAREWTQPPCERGVQLNSEA
jgi:hypothetical protein